MTTLQNVQDAAADAFSTAPAWGGVFAVASTVACILTAELLPVSLLTPMAQDLGVSEGVAGQAVTVVNAPVGTPLRTRFLALVLQQDDEQYRAYWTVRRHVGKGAPPREPASSAEVIAYVMANPGAVGYIDASELRNGMNVVLRP